MASTKVPIELSSTPGIVDNSNATAITIDSSENVGIGTSNPTAGGGLTLSSSTTAQGFIDFKHTVDGDSGFIGNAKALIAGATTNQLGVRGGTNGIAFSVEATEAMRINSTGNVGIGVTPVSAEGSFLQFGSQYSISQRGFGRNTYFDGSNYRAIATGGATLTVGGDDHIFYTASSVSAGATQAFTERMRIDSSGNVGINWSASTARLGIIQSGSSTPGLNITDGTSSDFQVLAGYSSGLCVIGPTAGSLAIKTANTERMRIDSSGRVGIGETSYVGALTIRGEVGQSFHAIDFTHNSSTVVGNVVTSASSTAYNTSSDYRLKENVRPIENGLERLNQLNPVKFDWKVDGTSSEGFIAHEAQEIFPDAVSGKKDGEKMQGMDYGRMTPLLVKAIQEQQVLIEQLQAEVALLKGE